MNDDYIYYIKNGKTHRRLRGVPSGKKIVGIKIKAYEKKLIDKLPNEYKNSFHDYNPYNHGDHWIWVDDNNYGNF